MARKHGMPGWFPYALAASAVVAIGAGLRSGWKTSADQPKAPPPPPPPPSNALSDWFDA